MLEYKRIVGSYEGLIDDYRGQANLIIADPPYNLGLAGWDVGFDLAKMLRKLSQMMDKYGTLLIWNTAENVELMRKYVEAGNVDLTVQDTIIWRKTNPNPNYFRTRGYLKYDKEYCLYLTKNRTKYTFNNLYKQRYTADIMAYPLSSAKHITSKPVLMIEEQILHHSNIGDLVIEPFGGGRPALVASMRTYRSCVSTELSRKIDSKCCLQPARKLPTLIYPN